MQVESSGGNSVSRRTGLAATWCLICLLGCGGDAEKSPKKKKGGQPIDTGAAAAAQAQAPAAVLPALTDAPAPASAVTQAAPASPANDAGDDDDALAIEPGDTVVYKVLGDFQAGTPFEIAKQPAVDDSDRFALTPAGPGLDSSAFAVTGLAAPPLANAALNPPAAGPAAAGGKADEEFRIPAGFTPLPESGKAANGLPWRLRCDKDGSTMVLVPAGTFLRGTDEGPQDAAPTNRPWLSSFYIDTAEVTSDQYESYRSDLRQAKKRAPEPARQAGDPQEPVLGVNWGEASAYARWAGKELPTEAQWEKAARGEHGFRHPWGNGVYLWQRPRLPGQIDRVRTFPGDLSPYGVFDLAGNAREWCADWYSPTAYRDSGSGAINPAGPKNAMVHQQRVVRGGDPNWLVWSRTGVVSTEHLNDIGFRCVLNSAPEPKDNTPEKTRKPKTPRPADPQGL